MSTERCSEAMRDRLAEAALGVLAEPERGEVLAHAQSCDDCRRSLGELVQVSDRVVALAPEAEPPPGFEQRVLGRVTAARGRPRSRPWGAVAAALVLVVVGLGVGMLLAPDDGGRVEVVAADMRTADGERVGRVLLADGADRGVIIRLDRYREGAAYTCQLLLADGTTVDVATWRAADGDGPGWWVAPIEHDGSVVGARLVVADGTVWADGRMD